MFYIVYEIEHFDVVTLTKTVSSLIKQKWLYKVGKSKIL